jgi:hypothetical protein
LTADIRGPDRYEQQNSLLPPNWAWIALAVAVAGLLISAAVPAGRSFLRSWLTRPMSGA